MVLSMKRRAIEQKVDRYDNDLEILNALIALY